MKKCWTTFIFFLLFLPGYSVAQDEHAGVIKTMFGEVDIRRGQMLVTARPGIPVIDKDVVVTSYNAFAGIMFTDGTVITIGPGTEFRIDTYIFEPQDDAYYFSFYLEKGSAIYNSGKIGKLSPQSVKLATPKATVGIRGTRFIIDVN
jgi:hypothetical protein